MSLRDAWETRAPDWVRWARSPELDDDLWSFHLPEFLRLLPAPGRLTVDVGCGEGRLGRVLARSGHRVVGFDASLTSVGGAATHPEGHPVAVADAVRLPLPDDAADLAIAFMSLQTSTTCQPPSPKSPGSSPPTAGSAWRCCIRW
jgi:SAM-dependent methyltransferase